MNKVLFATTNTQKIRRLRKLTSVKLLDLSDLPYKILEPEEQGEDALDIAIIKSRYYFSMLKNKLPVLTQDDTIKMQVEPSDDPGSHIKSPVIRKYGEFTDDNALTYYTNLAKKYGGEIKIIFEYGHALCFDDGEETIRARRSKLIGRIVTKPHENQSTSGYFLSAIFQVKLKGKWRYYSELTDSELVQIDRGISQSLQKLFI